MVRRAIGADPDAPEHDRLVVVEQSRGPTTRPPDSEVYTYRTWWHSRGPAATSAMAFRQIGQVWAPILLVQGTGDEVVRFEEAVALAGVARAAGNRDVTVMRIDERRPLLQGPRDRDPRRGPVLAAAPRLGGPRQCPASRTGAPAPPTSAATTATSAIDLVVTKTEDGQSWDGMIYRPSEGDPDRRRLAVLVVHGSVGNYLSGVPRRISFGLANAGFTVMSVNTRMANYGVIFGGGLMHRTPLDLDAAIDVLRRRGFRRIVLLGFSMGATVVTHYQALRQPAEVVGVATLAHPASLPAALRLRWDHFGADPGYEEVAELVHTHLAPDFEDARRDRIFIVRRARGFGERPLDGEVWTYRTWWYSRGPRAPHAESRLRIGHVTVPARHRPGRRGRAGARRRGLRARGDRPPGRLPERLPHHDPRRRPRLRRLRRRADRGRRRLAGRAALARHRVAADGVASRASCSSRRPPPGKTTLTRAVALRR